MEYTIEKLPDSHLITLHGAFRFNDHVAFEGMLDSLKNIHAAPITIDFADVGFIDSTALGMLLLLREEQEKHEMHVTLRGARGLVKNMFEMGKFTSLFKVEE